MNELGMFIKFIHEKNIVYNRSLILYLTEYPTLKDLSDRFTKIREGFQMMEELIK